MVGFAAETNDVLMNAHAKLAKKNADMIVANQVGDGLAFGTDNNEVWLVTEGDDVLLPLMSKRAVAELPRGSGSCASGLTPLTLP